MSPPTALLDDLRDGVTAPLTTAPEVLERYAHDFGGLVRRLPAVVVHARCEADVAHTLRVARAHRIPVSLRGSGHSSGGQCLSEGGIILANEAEAGEVRPLEDGRVEVTARTRWERVEAVLNPLGRTMPVLTSSLATSVGGTLSVGGFGSRSLHHGAQVDQVERLRLLLPDGTAVWCGPEENAELFRFSLAGLGQVGIIERVVMRTRPYQPFTRLWLTPHAHLSDLVEAVAWTEHGAPTAPEHFLGIWKEGRLWSIFGQGFPDEHEASRAPLPEPLRHPVQGRQSLDAPPQILALSAEEDTRQRTPSQSRLWCDYCFDLEGLRHFARFVERERSLWTPGLKTLYLLGLANPPSRLRWPFDMRGEARGAGRRYALGLYYGVRAEDRQGLAAAEAAHRLCLEWCLRAGGRPYLYGRNLLGPEQHQALYGEELTRLRTLRQTLDPDGLLNPHGFLP